MAEGKHHLGEIRSIVWNELDRLPELVYPPRVGQTMWWLLEDNEEMNLEKVTIQAGGDNANAFSVLHMSGLVHDSINVDVQNRVEIHNDIVRKALYPSYTAQLGPDLNGGTEEDSDEESQQEVLDEGGDDTVAGEGAIQGVVIAVPVEGVNDTVTDEVGNDTVAGEGVNDTVAGEEETSHDGPKVDEELLPEQVSMGGAKSSEEDPGSVAPAPALQQTAASLLGLSRKANSTAELTVIPALQQTAAPQPEIPPPAPAELTVAKLTKLLLEVKKRDLERKKRQRELDDEDMSSVAHLSKQLKVAKAERKQVLLERKKVLAETEAAEARAAALDSDDCPEVADGQRKPKAKPTSLDYWQLGNKCARKRKDGMVADAICEDLPAVWRRLQSHGWAIKKKMKDLFTNDCQPSKEQADYILKTNLDNKFGIFDNAVWSDTSSSISLEQKFDRLGARMQLKASNHSGKWQKVFLDYTKKYNK